MTLIWTAPVKVYAKKFQMWLAYRMAEGVLFLFRKGFKALPVGLFRLVTGSVAGTLISIFLSRRRIIKNLDIALGETHSPATKKGIAKGVKLNTRRNIQDCIFQWLYPRYVFEQVTITGMENLQVALSRRKGVIALGAHLGNYVLVGARLGLEGYRFHTLIRIPSDKRVQDIIKLNVNSFHQNLIPSLPRRIAVARVLSALKDNDIVFILADNLKKGKIPTSLFGQTVFSPRGPVSLALRSGAVVLPIYLVRNYQGGHDLIIDQEIPMTRNGSLPVDIAKNTHRTMVYLEDLIRRYPDQWSWLTVRMRGRRQVVAPPGVFRLPARSQPSA
jgi:KDO2-lipid IV(A) lauroyltransferase